MGREVRRVPKNWVHPSYGSGYGDDDDYIPLFDDFRGDLNRWVEGKAQWDNGFYASYRDGGNTPKWYLKEPKMVQSWEEWSTEMPQAAAYMPEWSKEEATYYQMYENTTEGTPISPVMETPEELAAWLADNKASTFASMTATYEQWLNMIKGPGFSFSMALTPDGIKSGVEISGKNCKE